MSIFISAGHNSKSKTIKQDPGAVNKQGIKEGDLTIEFRDLVCQELDLLNAKYIKDLDEESLSMYLNRVKTGSGSVVVEYHFDSATIETATGTTGIVEAEAEKLDKDFAKELNNSVSTILGIKSRGVISENESHRGRLGLMREDGIICLVELCFITNPQDLIKYNSKKKELAKAHALIISKYENIII
jgi:N-acetylmuramoyl-L-alanine amidase